MMQYDSLGNRHDIDIDQSKDVCLSGEHRKQNVRRGFAGAITASEKVEDASEFRFWHVSKCSGGNESGPLGCFGKV